MVISWSHIVRSQEGSNDPWWHRASFPLGRLCVIVVSNYLKFTTPEILKWLEAFGRLACGRFCPHFDKESEKALIESIKRAWGETNGDYNLFFSTKEMVQQRWFYHYKDEINQLVRSAEKQLLLQLRNGEL